MLKIYYRILISAWHTFGFGLVFLRWLIVMPLFAAFTSITLFLDNIFFPQYKNVEIKQPIFLIGHGRSGTTFLHRLLNQTGEFAVFELWHLLFPALTARILVKPLIKFLIKTKQDTIYPKQVGHELTLTTVEEEEVLFLHKLDTQFVLFASPLGFDDQEHPEIRFHDQQPAARRKSSIKFFKECLQRQILYTGKAQIIAKPNYSIHRIKTLIEEFPDAKFVYLVRSPYETIPSHLSLHRNIFDNQWGIENIPIHKLMRYYQRRYNYNIDLYRYFYQCQEEQEIPKDQVMVVKYDALHSDLYRTFENIVAFAQLKCSEELQNAVLEQSKLQGEYRRVHAVMDIEQFGLTKQQITNDLNFVFAAYGLKTEPEEDLISKVN